MIVHLVEVHAVWKHLLNISYLNWIVRREILAVDFNTSGVCIVEAPDVDFLDVEHEVSTGLPMKRFVFLDWVDWHLQQVRAPNDVTLECHVQRVLSFEVMSN